VLKLHAGDGHRIEVHLAARLLCIEVAHVMVATVDGESVHHLKDFAYPKSVEVQHLELAFESWLLAEGEVHIEPRTERGIRRN